MYIPMLKSGGAILHLLLVNPAPSNSYAICLKGGNYDDSI